MTHHISQRRLRRGLLGKLGAVAGAVFLGAAACEPIFLPDTFTAPVWGEDQDGNVVVTKHEEVKSVKFAEGKMEVFARALNQGKVTYRTYCASCHGVNGDGKGPAGEGLVPPPRNFTDPLVVFKFTSVKAGELPPDSDLVRTVTSGLHGTAMLKWGIDETRLLQVIQYIKTFSKRWLDEAPAAPIEIPADPFTDAAKRKQAVEQGKLLYHTKTSCHLCHPSYVNQTEYNKLQVAGGKVEGPMRPDASWSVVKPSDSYKVNITPPDFTWHELRSIKPLDMRSSAETRARELPERMKDTFRAIATGIGGTAMPTWKGAITDEEIWALTHYVQTLTELKDDPAARDAFMGPLRAAKQ
jgi:mono/diheme cytochrome c family protein